MLDKNDNNSRRIKQAVCIDAPRVYDSCADKDCIADVRVYFTDAVQELIENAVNVRCRDTQVINVFTQVESVPFNRGFYSVDLTFFFAVTLDVFAPSCARPETVSGLSVFSKKCILYGSDGSVKIFSSESADSGEDGSAIPVSANPRAKIQVAEPLCLDARLCRVCDCCDNIHDLECGIPTSVKRRFYGSFCNMSTQKAVRATIGLFSIVQLERDVQMLVPAYDFCVPTKECSCDTQDPCDAFRKIKFPVGEFFPPSRGELDCDVSVRQNDAPCQCSK